MKIIKTYENYNSLDDLDLGRFSHIIEKDKLIPNPDGTYDYKGDLYFSGEDIDSLLEIPIRFRNVYGNCNFSSNHLFSLEGCPLYVSGFFNCLWNNLISLQYAPLEVGGNFNCMNNFLLSNVHLTKIKGNFFGTNQFEITDDVIIEAVKAMTHEQQMKELNFFDEHDANASRMLQEILFDLGVDFGTHRKEMLDRVKGNDNLKSLGL